MNCDISGEQLWSWIDRDAPELDEHLAVCPTCRARAAKIRDEITQLAHDEAFELPVPEKIGSYTIIRLIGEGGQALVYEAEQLSPRRRVALKVLKGGHLVGKKDIRKFRRESQALGRLNHPSIATIYESGRTQEGLHFFAMELVDGCPLHTFVKDKKPSQEELLDIFRKVCDAVQYAHDNGVIHRDLKPSNIMIDEKGSPKILDFGLARLTQGDYGTLMTATRYGSVEGTPRYMSPEQALGRTDEIDFRTDVYALGVVLYEILTGQPPNRVTIISPDTVRTICEELPPKPSHIAPDLGEGLDAILLTALEKEPGDRFHSVAEMREDISRYLEGKPVLATLPGTFYGLRKNLLKRKLPLGIATLVLVGITALAIWFPKPDQPDSGPTRRIILEYKYAMFQQDASDFNYYDAREAPRRFPGSPEAVVVAAQAYCLTRGQNVAMGLLFRAQEGHPGYWPYEVLINEIRAWQQPGGTALADTSYWNADLALSADAWYERSFATLDMKNALAWAQRALDREPTHELALTTVALVSEILDDPERAVATAQILIDTHPDLANKWMHYRAELFVRMNRLQDALDQTLEWQKVSPDFYYAYLMAAKVARRMSRFAEAERYFTLAIEKQGPDDPQTTWLYFHRGTTRWLVGRKEDAISDYRRSWAGLTYPTYGNARLYILLEETGHHDEAVLSLEQARKSRDVDPWLRRIFDCLAGELTPGRLAAVGEASGNPVETCEGYYYAAEASLLNGFTDEAAMWFRKCLDTGVETDPDDPTESISEYQLARERLKELNGVTHASDETTKSP